VTFNVLATTILGEDIYIVGSVDELRNWNPENGVPLDASNYPTWTTHVNITADTRVEYKYIRRQNGATTWESDPNRVIETPGDKQSLVVNDTWR
jgi:glucoamylase